MSNWLHRLAAIIPPGIRGLIGLLLVLYLSAFIGKQIGVIDLYSWLGLSSPDFWRGRVWQVITYASLPAGFLDFIFNSVVLAMLATRLLLVWTPRQLLAFCVVVAFGAGLGKVLLTPYSLTPLLGTTGVVLGLLVACWRLLGSQAFTSRGMSSMTFLGLAAVPLVITLIQQPAGLVAYLPPLCGGITGWLFISVSRNSNSARHNVPVTSARIGKLEL